MDLKELIEILIEYKPGLSYQDTKKLKQKIEMLKDMIKHNNTNLSSLMGLITEIENLLDN